MLSNAAEAADKGLHKTRNKLVQVLIRVRKFARDELDGQGQAQTQVRSQAIFGRLAHIRVPYDPVGHALVRLRKATLIERKYVYYVGLFSYLFGSPKDICTYTLCIQIWIRCRTQRQTNSACNFAYKAMEECECSGQMISTGCGQIGMDSQDRETQVQ